MRSRQLLALGSTLMATPLMATEATLYITCYSMPMAPATTTSQGAEFTLSFTNPDADDINGEWFLSGGTSEISSMLVLDTPFGQLTTPHDEPCTLTIPNNGDTDVNVLTDFFEVSKSVDNATTTGQFAFDNGADVFPGTLKATWNRAAGSSSGTCNLQLSVPDFGLINVKFAHNFEILQYKGTLNYTVSGTNVASTVSLKREGGTSEFTGPWPLYQFSRSSLGWKDAPWIGPGGTRFDVLASDAIPDFPFSLDRAGLAKSDFYLGAFFFADGNPSTPFPDEYDLWEIVVVDANDSDGDNIPDLSDEPASVVPPTPVSLAVRMDSGHLKLVVTGKAGQSVQLEQQLSLSTAGWIPGQKLTLATDTQEFDLGTPAADVFFVRARSQ